MAANLKDSGTSGRYGVSQTAFSSIAYGRYVPSVPDYSTKFYAHLKRWRFETLTSSSADDIVNHKEFREIVKMGEIVVPLIVSELRRRPDFLIAALALITGQNPVMPSQLGDVQAMTQAWIDWYDHNC